MLAYLGVALMVILSGVGSSIGITISGKAVVGGMKKDPTQMGKYILSLIHISEPTRPY